MSPLIKGVAVTTEVTRGYVIVKQSSRARCGLETQGLCTTQSVQLLTVPTRCYAHVSLCNPSLLKSTADKKLFGCWTNFKTDLIDSVFAGTSVSGAEPLPRFMKSVFAY